MNTEGKMGSDLHQLADRIRQGEKEAEEELVERFQRGLSLALRRRSQDPTLAEDLTQDTLLLVLEKIRRNEVREPERLAGFIHGTARHLLQAHRRKNARFVALESASGEVSWADTPPAADEKAGQDEAGALSHLLRKEEARLVRQLLDELTIERDRQLLIRFYLSHQAKSTICADLAIDEEHFRRVLFRARERLKELWQRFQKRQQLLGEMG
ncbi:MAG: sigma-70 family RNA polymerase sigma factor [Deltaproteobacteria bacterium]|nr:sigma-70 family RNA polymerase sigma factor [Deltaproteobacteria bacterium]